jgi:porphobilinogen deaminase
LSSDVKKERNNLTYIEDGCVCPLCLQCLAKTKKQLSVNTMQCSTSNQVFKCYQFTQYVKCFLI